ncbi:MAG: methyl-accepting chemotaxis protein [Lachnospiraceae bacterium]|nr:methyl-accepting chemotaxis protein [Lachnospiraceae bacterium]
MKKKAIISMKGAIILMGLLLIITLIGCVGYFSGQLLAVTNKYQEIYFDTLYRCSEKLLNADRDLYQSMMAATQGYDIKMGYADIPEEYVVEYIAMKQKDFKDNLSQTIERVNGSAEIAKTMDTLYKETKDADGRSFEENYQDFTVAIKAWQGLFDVETFTGEWGNFNNDFEALRGYISNMTDICEDWAIMEENIIKTDTQRRINMSMISFAVIIIITIVGALAVFRIIKKSIRELNENVARMADGDFATHISVNSKFKEFELLGKRNEEMRSRLREAVSHVIEDANNVSLRAEETKKSIHDSQMVTNDISIAVENLALAATEMAGDVMTTSDITIDIGSSIDNVSNSVKETLNKVKNLSESSTNLKAGLDILKKADEETDMKAEQVADSVKETAEVVKKISSAAAGIINIAGQTNLLALNASIEAARAGEAGRGFSVVAENIKGLASESDRLAGEITSMLNDISKYSDRNMELTASIKEATVKETESFDRMIEAFNTMLEVLDAAEKENEDAAQHTLSMSSKKEGILQSVESLSSISEENAASTEETSASLDQLNFNMKHVVEEAENLTTISEHLKTSVSYFRI